VAVGAGPKVGFSETVSSGSMLVARLARQRRQQPIARAAPTTIGPTAPSPKRSVTAQASAAIAAAAGSVSSQPATMRPATDQLTAAPGRPTPDPVTAPETTCVVDSG
jgi:hypothetical protein